MDNLKQEILDTLEAGNRVKYNIYKTELMGLTSEQLMVLLNILYNLGSGIQDLNYDILKDKYIKINPDFENILHEDIVLNADDTLKDLAKRYTNFSTDYISSSDKYYKSINDLEASTRKLMLHWPPNKSIKAYRTDEEFTNEVLLPYYNLGINQYIVSWKYDGWNTITYFDPQTRHIIFAHNRSRNTEKFIDMTELLKAITSNVKIQNISDEPIRVVGELILKNDMFKDINRYLHANPSLNIKPFETPRMALSAIVSGTLTKDLIEFICGESIYNILSYKTFTLEFYDGRVEEQENQFAILESFGFGTVNYVIDEQPFINNHAFISRMISMYTLYRNTGQIESSEFIYNLDGIVIQPRFKAQEQALLNYKGRDSNYKNAYKSGIWAIQLYKSKIKDFELSSGSKYITIRALIEPIKTMRGSVSYVPLQYNKIIEDQIEIGDTIIFSDRGDVAIVYEGKEVVDV